MRYFLPLIVIFILTITLLGCSTDPNQPSLIAISSESNSSGVPEKNIQTDRQLLGYYSMVINPANLTASIIPDRELSTHFNLSGILPVKVTVSGYNPADGTVDVNVTIKNTYTINGYDLRLIIFQNVGHNLLNADNWTDLYDLPGGLPINPFKAYAATQPNRKFGALEEYTERLLIKIPSGNFNVKFAIDASWPDNCKEPYEITNYFQGYLNDYIGAQTSMHVDALDWQNDISLVSLYCPQVTGQESVNFSYLGGDTYKLDLVNATGVPEGIYFGTISALSNGGTLYQTVNVEVIKKKTIGVVFKDQNACDGYTLIEPFTSTETWLIDMEGRIVNQWHDNYFPGAVVYLLDNGNLLRTGQTAFGYPGGAGGRIREFDWDNNLVWDFAFSSSKIIPHHDVKRLSNGNTLIIAWEKKTSQEALNAGRKSGTLPDNELLPDAIFEVKQTGLTTGDIVWEWRAWDHLSSIYGGVANGNPVSTDIADPGKLNINYYISTSRDWLHCNSVYYNPELDQIIVSSHNFSELFVIDHSTANYKDPQAGIELARGPAGDIKYRWGNPRAYSTGTSLDQMFYYQHDCQWIEKGLPGEGNILVFNNGFQRPQGSYSTIEEIVPPVDASGNYFRTPGTAFGPQNTLWIYTANPPTSFYSAFISGCQRMPNGNTLICEGDSGHIFEVNSADDIVWDYITPMTPNGIRQRQGTVLSYSIALFRCYRYGKDFPAFNGRTLTPGDYLEYPRG